MRRLAVVDMLVDLELPERFNVSYDFHNNLVAADTGAGLTLELGGDAFAPNAPDILNGCAEHVASKARADGEQLVLDVPGLAIVNEPAQPRMLQWTAGFGNRLLVATLASVGTVWSDPFTFVAKRWEDREGPFLSHGVSELCRIIARQTAAG